MNDTQNKVMELSNNQNGILVGLREINLSTGSLEDVFGLVDYRLDGRGYSARLNSMDS